MKVWLCKFEGLLTPAVVSGPFDSQIPDEEVIEAMKGSLQETDLLFWIQVEITLTAKKKFIMTPKMGTFSSRYMDEMRRKARE